MLVLTRKQNEQIRIGNEITVTVIRTKGKAVRLGIEAPSHIGVLRGELVFDSEEESAATGAETKAETPAKPAAEGRAMAVRQTAAKEGETRWPSSRDRQQSVDSVRGAATFSAAALSAVTMRQFIDSRVGV